MGGMTSFEFVSSNYKIRYIDSLLPSNITSLDGKDKGSSGKKIKVLIPNKLISGTVLQLSPLAANISTSLLAKNTCTEEGKGQEEYKGLEITFKCLEPDLTVGWLLSEVTRKYNEILLNANEYSSLVDSEESKGSSGIKPKHIIGLKTVEGIMTLDYYLCQLDNSLAPLKEETLLTVHYSEICHDTQPEKVGKDSFQYLKVIGCGGYSKVVLARK